MQVVKRVSLSRPNTFYRGYIKIESLGSHYSLTQGDQTHRWGWLDAGPQCLILGFAPRVPLHSTSVADHQRLEYTALALSHDRTCCLEDRTRRCIVSLRAHPSHRALIGRAAPRDLPTSGHFQRGSRAPKPRSNASGPPWLDAGRRPILPSSVRAKFSADVSVHPLWPDVGPARPVTITMQRLVAVQTEPKHANSSIIDRTHSPQVRSVQKQRPVTENNDSSTPKFAKLLHPCSKLLTTKCITLCICVSMFSQTFSRVLALH
jgi:hypothetical protein